MNIALWLERAGLSHGDRPAIGHGTRVVRSYGELAQRAARLAGALRTQCGLAPGERVAIFAKNSPEYMEALNAIWTAGLAAVPVNAKLHGRELAYILEHSGARVCFVSADLEAAASAHAPASLQRLITIGSREHEALFAGDAIAVVPRSGDDLAWLFYTSGTTGRPKGAMLTHRVLSWASHAYLSDVDHAVAGDAVLHAAPMSHGSGMYIMPHVARLGTNVIPESGALRARRDFRAVPALAAHHDVRGAHHDQAPDGERRRLRSRKHPHHRLGRCADVCRGRHQGARPLRAAICADLRPGRRRR